MRAEENRCSNRRPIERNHSQEDHHRLIHRINDGARDALVDDFRNGTLAEGKDGCAARHRLDHHQAERLRPIDREQKRLRAANVLPPMSAATAVAGTASIRGYWTLKNEEALQKAGVSTMELLP
jgi:hypothetical protein